MFRTRYAQALLAASKGVLQASGNLRDIERKLNMTVSKVARCQNITVVAYYDPGRWYLTPGGTRHPLQVRLQYCVAHLHQKGLRVNSPTARVIPCSIPVQASCQTAPQAGSGCSLELGEWMRRRPLQ